MRSGENNGRNDDDDDDDCDVEAVDLLGFSQWQREEGLWWGEYTFLGAQGDPFVSASWNYPYGHYWGFIRMKIEGNRLVQRNVFIYPPQNPELCENGTPETAEGTCGVNGNEKVFEAEQTAVDCQGNLAGPFNQGGFTVDTFTTLVGTDAVLYQVKTPFSEFPAFSEKLIQSQLTTLPGNGVRVRTAQGFSFGTELPSSASFYREYRLATLDEWLAKLQEIRTLANIASGDECGFDNSNIRTSKTCFEHFMLSDFDP